MKLLFCMLFAAVAAPQLLIADQLNPVCDPTVIPNQPICPGRIAGNPVFEHTFTETEAGRSFTFGPNVTVQPGDVILCDPASETGLAGVPCDGSAGGRQIWSDILRFTCADLTTNTGCTATLFSDIGSDDPAENPTGDSLLPVNISANQHFFFEQALGGAAGLVYTTGQAQYTILSETPEPSGSVILGPGLLYLAWVSRRRLLKRPA